MESARRVADMTDADFMRLGSSFNKTNLELGQNATPEQVAELKRLHAKAQQDLDAVLAKAENKTATPEDINRLGVLSGKVQYFSEAIQAAPKESGEAGRTFTAPAEPAPAPSPPEAVAPEAPTATFRIDVPKPDLSVVETPVTENDFGKYDSTNFAVMHAGTDVATGDPLYWIVRKISSLKSANPRTPSEAVAPEVPVAPPPAPVEAPLKGYGQHPSEIEARATAPEAKPVETPPSAPTGEAPPAVAKVQAEAQKPQALVKAQQAKEAAEFRRLVQEHGEQHGWIQKPDSIVDVGPGSEHLGTAAIKGKIGSDKELASTYRRALKDLGLPTDKNSAKLHAEALPKLKAWLAEHEKLVEVPLGELGTGSTFTHHGEKYTVGEANADTGMVKVRDGIKLDVPIGGAVKADPGSVKAVPVSTEFLPEEKPGLELAKPESVQEQQARLQTEQAAAEKKAWAEEVTKGASKPLVGSVGDIGQGDLLGGGDLFSQRPKPAVPGNVEMTGMGGAVPSEFGGTENFVSNMFAAIDRDRAEMGKPPMAETRPRTWDEDNQRALAQMNRDPSWIPDLLDRMEKQPRPLLSWENAGVVWQRAKWKAEYNNALQRVARAFDDKRTEDLTAAKTDAAVFEDKLERLDRIVGRNGTGSEAGRSLQAQKMGAGDDFTLVEMTLQKRAAVGGRRLTPQETSAIQKDVDRLNSLNAALVKNLADAEARASAAKAAQAIAELKSQIPSFDIRVLKAAESIVVKMESRAVDASARLREKLMRMSAGVDPTIIYDASIIGSAKIARLGLDFARFTDAMVKDFGEKIRPLMADIWQKSNEMLEANLARVPEPVRRVVKKAVGQDVRKEVAAAVKEQVAAGDMSKVTWQVYKLARELVKSGITDREALIDAVHQVLSESIPGVSRREAMDAISGYGQFKRLTKDRISLTLRGMQGEMQQLAKLEDMASGKPPLKTGLERRTPTDAERLLIKEVNDAKNKFQVPVENPETQLKSALDTLKTTLRNRIADYEDRLARKDYAPRPRREVQLDTEANRLRAESERIKKRWRQALLSDRMKNRTAWEKALDWGTKFRRFTALSSPVVIPKLIGAAGWRAVSTLAEDVSGGALSFVPGIRQISQRAPIEGYGGQLKATMRGFGAAFTRGLVDAAKVGRTGHSDIDVLYGKAGESYTGESEMASVLLSLPGRFHGVIKAPVKRGAFEKTAQRLGEYYARQGLDVTSDSVKLRIAVEAYKEGNRAIFLQDNRVASGFNAALAALESRGETGHPSPGGKVLATTARFMFPVTRVPTNIAAETLQYGAGTVTGSMRAINAIRKGLDTLTPNQADLIIRELKKGSIGMAALLLGYMGYQSVGGVYEQGKKPKPGDIKPNAARLFGQDIPENILHAPVINAIQLGATIHQTAEEKLRKKDPEAQGFTAGLLAASWGLADEVPFVQGPHRLFGGLADPRTRQKTLGMEIGSVTIPQAIAWLAQVLDERRETAPTNLYQRITGPPAKLRPANVLQSLESRVPGLRKNVPLAAGAAGAPTFKSSFVK